MAHINKIEGDIPNSPIHSDSKVYYPLVPPSIIKSDIGKSVELDLGTYILNMSGIAADNISTLKYGDHFDFNSHDELFFDLDPDSEEWDKHWTIMDSIEDMNVSSTVAFNHPDSNLIGFMRMPKHVFRHSAVEDVLEEYNFEGSQYSLKSFTFPIYFLSALQADISYEEFESTVRHESTHFYINSKTRRASETIEGRFSLGTAIHEGAARVTSYLTNGSETTLSGYRKQGVRAEDIQTAEKILHDKAEMYMDEGKSVEEAIGLIRKDAAKAYRNLAQRPDNDLLSAFREGESEYREIRKVMRLIENADMKMWHIVEFYGLSVEEKTRFLRRGPENNLHSTIFLGLNSAENDLLKGSLNPDVEEESRMLKAKRRITENEDVEYKSRGDMDRTSVMEEFLTIRKHFVQLSKELKALKKDNNSKEIQKDINKDIKYLDLVVEDLSELLKVYNKEEKLEKLIEVELEKQNENIDIQRIKEIYGDELFLSSKRIKQHEKELKHYLMDIIASYKKILGAAENINSQLSQVLGKIHKDIEKTGKVVKKEDQKIKSKYTVSDSRSSDIVAKFKDDLEKEYSELEESLEITEEVYKVTQNAEEHLEECQNLLNRAEELTSQM